VEAPMMRLAECSPSQLVRIGMREEVWRPSWPGLRGKKVMPLQIPDYEMVRSIPHLGVAEIDVVHHPVFGADVVRKRFDTLGLEDAIAFLEPRLLHQFRYPTVVRVHDAVVSNEGNLRIVEVYMPYYRDGSVYEALLDGPLSTQRAVLICRDVLSALSYIHDVHGIVHRDVKPANILLEGNRALLTDFGSAARVAPGADAPPSLGRSPLYEPPEGQSTVRGDLYALGMTLFEMLNGPLPYEELDYGRVVQRLQEGRRALPDGWFKHMPWVPRPLRRLVARAVALNPEDRPGSAAEFRQVLMDCRYIDWRRTDGGGVEGAWEGSWTGRRGSCRYRVEAKVLRGGRFKARAQRQYQSGWRSFDLGPMMGSDDQAERLLRDLFDAAAEAAAHHLPT
jgi:eukaryotic-like serine/threonine-protein kinase